MISRSLKLGLYKSITALPDYLGKYSDWNNIMLFLERIWELRAMSSEDSRYDNAYDDVYQHIINNSDWDTDQLYLTRLKLIDGDDKHFVLFLETVVHPDTRTSIEEISQYVTLINSQIQNEDVKLMVTGYFEELPIYKLKIKSDNNIDLPAFIVENRIPIYLIGQQIDEYPCLVLNNSNWDDYGSKTTMGLRYHQDASTVEPIGGLKIMKRNDDDTWQTLLPKFYTLSRDYCSLGQDERYYTRLKTLFPSNYQSILLALNDAAFFPKIAEEFENDSTFKRSLIRDNVAEQTYRTIRFELEGDQSLRDYFRFTYSFKPPFAEQSVVFHFDFEQGANVEHRIFALIGKNGTGKTSILSSLINVFSLQNSNRNIEKMPLFGKYFTVSYSVFDRFTTPEPNVAFNYVYCGLKDRSGNILNEEDRIAAFYESALKIKDRDLTYQWYYILKNFLSEDHLKLIFPSSQSDLDYSMVTFNSDNFTRIKRHFSSGESILIFIITKIVSEIRNNSLILYDEPETHLHPNAISSLMNSLFELLKTFRSFCIIATHSPIVIRELHPNDVYVLQREQGNLNVKKIEKDCFGENLTVITEEIFGNRDVNKHYLGVMQKLASQGYNFEEIISMIQMDNIPVSLNTILYLKSITVNENDEPAAIS